MTQAVAVKPSSFLTHVNGMRALAILGIVFYHLNAAYCPAGYFGVDAFLVISGYFLFASLMKAERPADIRYGSFLLKKSWRILPSWLVLCCVFCFGSALFMIPTDRVEVCNTALRSAFFGADYYIDHLYDYFNQKAHQNLFLHYWYLSITCQMYILIPLLLMLLLRFCTRRTAVVALGAIGLLSLVFYVLVTTPQVPVGIRRALLGATGMETAYYHLLPRLWEIMAGGAVLLLPAWPQKRRLRLLLETLGAVGMVLSFFLFETGSAQVYMAAVSAVLFIRYGGEGWASRLLSWGPIQWVGTISFSLYLWHWPIMAAWKYVKLGQITWVDEVGMLALSFLLAALAWRLIECLKMPRDRSRLMVFARLLPALLLVCFAVSIRPYYRSLRKAASEMLQGQGLILEICHAVNAMPRDEALLNGFPKKAYDLPPVYIGGAEGPAPSFMLIGDSHSFHTVPGLKTYCRKNGLRGIYLNNSVIPFWWCYKEGAGSWNEAQGEGLLEYLRQQPSVKYVFMVLLWQNRIYGKTLNENDGVPTLDWRSMRRLDSDGTIALREQGLRETCRRLKEMGIKVVFLGDVPMLPPKISPCEQWKKIEMLSDEPPTEFLTPVETHQAMAGPYTRLLKQLVADGDAWAYIDSAEALRRGDAYRTRNDAGKFLYSDNNHLTYAGSDMVGAYIMSEWERLKREENNDTSADEEK